MKFDNLVFFSHPIIKEAIQARVRLDNGVEVSVVCGEGLYSSSKNGIRKSVTDVKDVATFEILLEGDDDVRGWQTREEIDQIFEANEV